MLHDRLIDYFLVVGCKDNFEVDNDLSTEITDVNVECFDHLTFVPQLEDRSPRPPPSHSARRNRTADLLVRVGGWGAPGPEAHPLERGSDRTCS